jgi:GWxTD domain-containing protein
MRSGLIFAVVLLLFACSESKKISNQNLAYLFSPGVNIIYPDYRICNLANDTSRVFFNLLPGDMLFMKDDSTGQFKSEVAFFYRVMKDYDSKIPVDTGTYFYSYEKLQDSLFVISDFFDVSAPDSADYIIEITLTDLHRRQAVGNFLKIDRTGAQPAQNFLPIDVQTNKPFIKNFVNREVRLKLLNTNSENKKLYQRYFMGEYPVSPPPFSENELKPLSYSADETTILNLEENNIVTLDKPGIYHFQFDTLEKEGLTIFRFEEDFPRLTSAESLIESIRFLTTRQEYSKIISSKDQKKAVDNFWLEMAGNRERARVLIRSYYSRVQLSNIFYTSYLEGWKSDRGLIYIIFGPPAGVYRTGSTETWNYNQNYNYGPLNFTFDKIQNPFTDNDYKLRRTAYYEMPWYRAVDAWREGRVVNDSY